MKILVFSGLVILVYLFGAVDAVSDERNPDLEYELITGGAQVVPQATIVPVTKPTITVLNTPAPVDPNSKSFAFNPKTKTWTLIKSTDPQPNDDTLVWNQSNDKWLTQIARF